MLLTRRFINSIIDTPENSYILDQWDRYKLEGLNYDWIKDSKKHFQYINTNLQVYRYSISKDYIICHWKDDGKFRWRSKYDNRGNQIEFVDKFTNISMTYNEYGKQTSMIKTNTNVSGKCFVEWSKSVFCDRGNELWTMNSHGFYSESTYDGLGNTLTYKDSNDTWSESTYDELGNILTYKDSNGAERKYFYSDNMIKCYSSGGNKIQETVIKLTEDKKITTKYNSDGSYVRYEFDLYNNFLYGEVSSTGYWKRIDYDDKNNMIYSINSRGEWERCEYNDTGNQTIRENSAGFLETRNYCSNGHVSIHDSDGYVELDATGRLLQINKYGECLVLPWN